MRSNPLYYISPSAISIVPNANGQANDLAVYIASGTKIKVYCPAIGALGYVDNSFQEWTLTGHYFASGALKFDPAFIHKTFPMSEAWEAFKLYDDPTQVHGKLMLVNEA